MKRGKEINLKINDKYNTFIGTVDNKNPKSIYLTISSWFTPLLNDETINYSTVINKLSRDIRNTICNDSNIINLNKDKLIIDLDIRESGIRFNKKSYMCCEITFFQQNVLYPVTSNILIKDVENLTNNILNQVFEYNNHFKFCRIKN